MNKKYTIELTEREDLFSLVDEEMEDLKKEILIIREKAQKNKFHILSWLFTLLNAYCAEANEMGLDEELAISFLRDKYREKN